jgi:hypothetical protein
MHARREERLRAKPLRYGGPEIVVSLVPWQLQPADLEQAIAEEEPVLSSPATGELGVIGSGRRSLFPCRALSEIGPVCFWVRQGQTLTTGLLSAFLVNDAICLVMTPLVVEVTTRLGRTPIPYLLAVAMASNVGSVATITGNPQNIIIGVISHMPYIVFLRALAPMALIGLVLAVILTVASYRQEFRGSRRFAAKVPPARVHKPQMVKALVVTLGVIGAFLLGVPVAMAVISGAALLLATRQINPGKVYRKIDGPLLLMFASLFVVVAGAEKMLLSSGIIETARGWHLDNTWVLTGLTATLSNWSAMFPQDSPSRPLFRIFPISIRSGL